MLKALSAGLAICGFLFLLLGSAGVARLMSPDPEDSLGRPETAPIQLAELSEREERFSRALGNFSESVGMTIPEVMAKAPHQDLNVFISPNILDLPSDYPAHEFFRWLAKDADAIIRGRVVARSSHLTHDRSFVFTEYTIEVIEVIRDDPRARLVAGDDITLLRPGGTVRIGDITVSATITTDEDFPEGDTELLMYVMSLPDADAYRIAWSGDAFVLRDDSSERLSVQDIPATVPRARDVFLEGVRRGAAER